MLDELRERIENAKNTRYRMLERFHIGDTVYPFWLKNFIVYGTVIDIDTVANKIICDFNGVMRQFCPEDLMHVNPAIGVMHAGARTAASKEPEEGGLSNWRNSMDDDWAGEGVETAKDDDVASRIARRIVAQDNGEQYANLLQQFVDSVRQNDDVSLDRLDEVEKKEEKLLKDMEGLVKKVDPHAQNEIKKMTMDAITSMGGDLGAARAAAVKFEDDGGIFDNLFDKLVRSYKKMKVDRRTKEWEKEVGPLMILAEEQVDQSGDIKGDVYQKLLKNLKFIDENLRKNLDKEVLKKYMDKYNELEKRISDRVEQDYADVWKENEEYINQEVSRREEQRRQRELEDEELVKRLQEEMERERPKEEWYTASSRTAAENADNGIHCVCKECGGAVAVSYNEKTGETDFVCVRCGKRTPEDKVSKKCKDSMRKAAFSHDGPMGTYHFEFGDGRMSAKLSPEKGVSVDECEADVMILGDELANAYGRRFDAKRSGSEWTVSCDGLGRTTSDRAEGIIRSHGWISDNAGLKLKTAATIKDNPECVKYGWFVMLPDMKLESGWQTQQEAIDRVNDLRNINIIAKVFSRDQIPGAINIADGGSWFKGKFTISNKDKHNNFMY